MSCNSPNHATNQRKWAKENPDYAKKYREEHLLKQRAVQKAWRQRNHEKHVSRARGFHDKRRSFLNELKNKPCNDCGKLFPPYVMHFDHRDPSMKYKSISSLIYRSMETIMTEIAKCDLVCANCHAIRTYRGIKNGSVKIFGGIQCR